MSYSSPMSDKDLKEEVQALARLLGKSEARRRLVVEGVSPHTADKLMRGVYPSEIGVLLGSAIRKVLEAAKKAS